MQIPYILALPIILVVGIFLPESWAKTAMIYGFMIAYLLAYLLYGPFMESSRRQATLGKEALGIMVTDTDGKRVSFARALGRNLGKLVSAIIYYVGFVMIAFTRKKQGLHDMMAGCVVVKK